MENVESALKEISAKRARLVEAGLLEQDGEDTTAQVLQHIDTTNLPVLSVYVRDTEKKLGVFDSLVAKVELFKRSINDRFLYKQLSVNKEGFGLTTPEGSKLDPLSLSSGEQHEIVLLYELLFKAAENSLILLDEPEISLRVAWQEQFLSNLEDITALSKFDALIATHSPQIISDRWDLTVELRGPLDEVHSHSASHRK
jgi:predicted ATP-binding protein involved in virulence